MTKLKRIENFISFFLFTGLFLNLVFVYFAQERVYQWDTTGIGILGPEKYLRILSVIAIFLVVIFSIFNSRNKFHISVYFTFSLLFFTILANYLISGADLFNMTQFMDKRGVGTWVCFGLIFVSYNDRRYEYFKKFLYLSVIVISIFCIYNFLDFGVGLWRGQALSKYRVYATNLVWIVPYVFLILKQNPQLKWFRFYALSIGILVALITQTRSFLLIYLFTILFDFINSRNKANYTVLLFVGLLTLLYLILNTEIFSTSLEMLINRGTQDTRTEQLLSFIRQLNPFELITGAGFFASYGFGGSQWVSVDNQWLYLFWWAGLLPVLCYLYLNAVIPFRTVLRNKISYETKVECFVIFIWVLGLTGLAIYSTMSVDFFFFIISIILGRILFKFSNGLK